MTSAASPTTTVYRVPHFHLPHIGPEFVLAGIAAVTLIAVYEHHKARAAARQKIIDNVLADISRELGVPALKSRPRYGNPADRWTQHRLDLLRFNYQRGGRDTDDTVQERIDKTVTRRLGYPAKITWDWPNHAGTLNRLEQQVALPDKILLPDRAEGPATLIPLAVTRNGPISWDLANQQQTNILVGGSTGSAKSTGEASLAAALTARGHEVWIVDGKGDSFDGFPNWPGVTHFAADPDNHQQMVATLEQFHQLRQQRSKQKSAGQTPHGGFRHIVLIADEVGLLIENGDKDLTDRAQQVLLNLVRGVRSVNMHVVIGVHQPSAKLLGGTETRRLFGVHIGLALRDRDAQLRQMLGVPNGLTSGTGRGRALIHMDGDNRTALDWTEAQTYFTGCGLPADLNPGDRAHQERLRSAALAAQPQGLLTGNLASGSQPDGAEEPQVSASEQPVWRRSERHPNGHQLPVPDVLVAEMRRLRDVEHLSVREIARRVGVSPTTVHGKLQRADREDRPALHVVRDGD